jgi:hypothetical protein
MHTDVYGSPEWVGIFWKMLDVNHMMALELLLGSCTHQFCSYSTCQMKPYGQVLSQRVRDMLSGYGGGNRKHFKQGL